ncbi:putative transmembrane protein [Gregarina niphandrodes]|uniref:Transmembrane protein n=1 Tax=Gregarina niphandrodes TaxID=110365 RepID=A0A023B5N9_GRENI|nr:putative transmembrane protein [Gregarina niphandrodes]EZG61412.1 putative transmembrane protein [Gregarina niphandrodes]|eukprot:XP_011130772.1 putative transmembrane protein [Gregarina niphandrodes]
MNRSADHLFPRGNARFGSALPFAYLSLGVAYCTVLVELHLYSGVWVLFLAALYGSVCVGWVLGVSQLAQRAISHRGLRMLIAGTFLLFTAGLVQSAVVQYQPLALPRHEHLIISPISPLVSNLPEPGPNLDVGRSPGAAETNHTSGSDRPGPEDTNSPKPRLSADNQRPQPPLKFNMGEAVSGILGMPGLFDQFSFTEDPDRANANHQQPKKLQLLDQGALGLGAGAPEQAALEQGGIVPEQAALEQAGGLIETGGPQPFPAILEDAEAESPVPEYSVVPQVPEIPDVPEVYTEATEHALPAAEVLPGEIVPGFEYVTDDETSVTAATGPSGLLPLDLPAVVEAVYWTQAATQTEVSAAEARDPEVRDTEAVAEVPGAELWTSRRQLLPRRMQLEIARELHIKTMLMLGFLLPWVLVGVWVLAVAFDLDTKCPCAQPERPEEGDPGAELPPAPHLALGGPPLARGGAPLAPGGAPLAQGDQPLVRGEPPPALGHDDERCHEAIELTQSSEASDPEDFLTVVDASNPHP